MKFRKTFIFAFSSMMLLTSCSGTSQEDSGDNNPNTNLPGGDQGGSEKPGGDEGGDSTDKPGDEEIILPTFSADDYEEELLGTFYNKLGTLTIDSEKLVLSGEDGFTLFPIKIEEIRENNAIRQAIYYINVDTKENYRVHLNYEEKIELSLEKESDDSFDVLADFMPSAQQFTGTYTGYGDTSIYNNAFIITNEYNSVYDSFNISTMMFGYGYPVYGAFGYYSKTYFQNVDGQMRVLMDIFDYEDDYLYYSVYLNVDGNRSSLIDTSFGGEVFVSDITMVYGTYFVSEDETLSFTYESTFDDATFSESMSPTIKMGDETFDLSLYYDDGSYYHLKNDSRDILIQGTTYGINLYENDTVSFYPLNDLSHLGGNYKNSALEFEFDSDTNELKINGVVTKYKKAIFDGKLAICTVIDGKEMYFSEYKPDVAIEMSESENKEFLTNYNEFVSYFNKSYELVDLGESEKLSIDEEFNVTYKGKETKGSLVYDPTLKYPFVKFSLDGVDYEFSIVELDKEAYALKSDGDEKYFFEDSIFETLRQEFTSGKGKISFSGTKMNYFGTDLTYKIKPVYDNDTFSYKIRVYFTASGEEHFIILDTFGMLTDYLASDEKNPLETYIPISNFNDFVGRYVFDGTYGPEAFELTSDGKFYADVLNESGDGLVYRQEQTYHIGKVLLADNTITTALQFQYDNMWIYLYKNEHSVTVFNTKYVDERLFAISGIFTSADLSDVLFVNRDVVYLNGNEVALTGIDGKLEANSTITFSLGDGTSLVATFDENKNLKTLTHDGVSLTKGEAQLKDFMGTWLDSSGNIFTVKEFIGLGGVADGLTITVIKPDGSSSSYEDYIVVNRNGKLALKVNGISETYYLIYSGGEVIVETESSIPLPPPPPPAPSF